MRYEAVIGSFLGETSSRLKRLFDFVRTHQCVLFFDEFDTLGKERGDTHETGEIKRVVSSLLLQIDALPSHVVVVTATNHAELLDRAVWRRFQLRLALPAPTVTQKEEWFTRLQHRLDAPLGVTPRTLAFKLQASSFSIWSSFARIYSAAMFWLCQMQTSSASSANDSNNGKLASPSINNNR